MVVTVEDAALAEGDVPATKNSQTKIAAKNLIFMAPSVTTLAGTTRTYSGSDPPLNSAYNAGGLPHNEWTMKVGLKLFTSLSYSLPTV